MNIEQAHIEIAKERFLDLMANEPDIDAHGAAIQAIEQADDFVRAYRALGVTENTSPKKLKGCAQCFGSGGKNKGCKACAGTGKIVVEA